MFVFNVNNADLQALQQEPEKHSGGPVSRTSCERLFQSV